MKRALLLLLLFVMVVAAACKQGQGDRCVVNADCQGGLICNQAKNTCEGANSAGGIDATVPDGHPADAMPDAKVFLDAGSGM